MTPDRTSNPGVSPESMEGYERAGRRISTSTRQRGTPILMAPPGYIIGDCNRTRRPTHCFLDNKLPALALKCGMLSRSLNNNRWTVQAMGDTTAAPVSVRGKTFPATVPGCVHLDLMRAGIIGDPGIGTNELNQLWVGHTDWLYTCRFRATRRLFRHENVDLACEGLDTISELSLNGHRIGEAANMFHPHRFSVLPWLRDGENELTILLKSPLKHIRSEESRLGARPVNGDWDPYIFIRKAACNFGWDWGPKVPTVGVWRRIGLEAWSGARIRDVRCVVRRADAKAALVEIQVDAEAHHAGASDTVPGSSLGPRDSTASNGRADTCVGSDAARQSHAPRTSPERKRADPGYTSNNPLPYGRGSWSFENAITVTDAVRVEVTLSGPGDFTSSTTVPLQPNLARGEPTRAPRDVRLCIPIRVNRPHLWWPLGHGEQPRYDLRVRLLKDGRVIDRSNARIGLRTTTLDTRPDAVGSKFQLKINGKPIFCKGANWIPDGLFASAITPAQLKSRVKQAADAGMNMLRVWGGGYYEDEAFYSECDRRGIMVWQDFMFACAMYPEESPYPSLVEAEARHSVARLSRHPSVVLWCGGNECVWGYQRWGWKQRLKRGQSWGKNYYLKLLPGVVQELAPTTPYWPNSPWSGTLKRDVLDERHGDRHTWDAKFHEYRCTIPRFLSEFGRQAPANIATLEAALPTDQLRVDSASMVHRQRATGGNAVMYAAVNEQMREPASFEEWVYASQLLQARALRIGLEWARGNQPRCMGVLPWQLNDCWPALSWSLIDSAGRPKPAMIAAQESYTPRLAMIHLVGPERTPVAYLANDTDEEWITTLRARRVNALGDVIAHADKHVRVSGRSARACWDIDKAIGKPSDPTSEYIELAGHRASATFFVPDVQFRYPKPAWSLHVHESARGMLVDIVATRMLRDVAIVGSGIEGVKMPPWRFGVMLPGERTRFVVGATSSAVRLNRAVISRAIRCANQFGVDRGI